MEIQSVDIEQRTANQSIQKNEGMYALRDERGKVKCFQQYPQVAIAHWLSIALTRLEAEFGMTPSARSRIYVPPVKPKHSKLAEFERRFGLKRNAGAGQS